MEIEFSSFVIRIHAFLIVLLMFWIIPDDKKDTYLNLAHQTLALIEHKIGQ